MSTHNNDMQVPMWLENLNFAFSLKNDGQMSFKRDSIETVVNNRTRLLTKYGLELNAIVAGELTHGNGIAVVDSHHKGRGAFNNNWIPVVDGFVTDSLDVLLLTTHADCAPIVIFDPVKKVLGQAHAGWRGCVAGIVSNLVSSLTELKNSEKSNIFAWIGPTIGPCCYPVSKEVAERFPSSAQVIVGNEIRLDLVKFIFNDLVRYGINHDKIATSGICTSCNHLFASFRRDKEQVNAMACISGLKE